MDKLKTDHSLVAIENLIESYSPELESVESLSIKGFLTQLKNIVASNNTLILKTISELLPLKFFVDDYQRGYKWQVQQVTELLNDIHEFELDSENFYCLQPVVVKYHNPENTGQRGRWELIDGQQRITTVYMILSFLEHDKYSIDYRTRTESAKFLRDYINNFLPNTSWDDFLNQHKGSDQETCLDNVDNYHFYTAYQVIRNWFSDKGWFDDEQAKERWLGKLLNHTKIIWYAAREGAESLDKQQSIDVFMRINSGKIPLTNAELIKALFLHGVASGQFSELALLQQSEMAQQWDSIEHGLQDDEFWAFLNTSKESLNQSSRIELLFDLISKKPSSANIKNVSTQDKFFAFNFYNNKIRDSKAQGDCVQGLWHEVKQGYYRLLEWYKDDELYHLTGFLISRKIQSVDKLWQLAERKGKSEFIISLKKIISRELSKYFQAVDQEDEQINANNRLAKLDFSRVSYETKNRKKIISLLILLNISVHRNNKTRLSFKSYLEESWDIEHIHAQQSKMLNGENEADVWYEDQLTLLQSTDIPVADIGRLKQSLSAWDDARSKDLKSAGNEFKKYLSDLAEVVGEFKEEDENALDNLCLLPASVNRGIGNEIFSTKRQKIINYEKGLGEGSSKEFIPAATKYVFSKYYSDKVSQMHKWSTSDRQLYKSALIDCFKYYGSMEGLS